jgi:hypothetical protein
MGHIDYNVEFLDSTGNDVQSPYLINTNYTLRLKYLSGEVIPETLIFMQVNFTLTNPTGSSVINYEYYSEDPSYSYEFTVSPFRNPY